MAKNLRFYDSIKTTDGDIKVTTFNHAILSGFDAWDLKAGGYLSSSAGTLSELGMILGSNILADVTAYPHTYDLINENRYTIDRNRNFSSYIKMPTGTYQSFGPTTQVPSLTSTHKVFYLTAGEIETNEGEKHCFIGFVTYRTGYSEDKYDVLISCGWEGDAFRADQFLNGSIVDPDADPYADGGISGAGGGGGNFDTSSDPIDIPDLPTLSASNTGFLTLYAPTLTQIQNLAHFMWSSDFLDVLLKLWNDPMQIILGLSIVPALPPRGSAQNIKAGNVDTEIEADILSTQYVEVDCGLLSVPEFFGAYLDYSPYTSISIYLPYIGTHELDIDEVMNATLRVVYHIDVLSGTCVCFVKSEQSVLYTFQGNCGVQIPITSENMSRLFQTVVNSVGNMIPSTINSISSGGITSAVTTLSSVAGAVANAKPSVSHSGTVGSSAGLMGVQYPYLILKRPRQCVPAEQNKIVGYGSYITADFSDLSGFTQIDGVNLSGIPCTDSERNEIMELLKKGVIF